MKAFINLFFLTSCGGAVSSFLKTQSLSHHLNRWTEFVLLFNKVFKGKCINVAFVEMASKFLMAYSVILCVSYILSSTYIYKACVFNLSGKCTWLEREQSILMTGFGCCSVANTCFEQYKLALLIQTIKHSFSQVSLQCALRKKYQILNF